MAASNTFQDITSKIGNFWSKISMSQRFFIGFLGIGTVSSFFLLVLWINSTDYGVLYSNLPQEDASKVIETLKKENVSYKLENSGSTIMVPEDKIYDTRIKIAGEGGLVGQGIGFEVFDDVKIGTSDHTQKINYQRALQGELSRTINEFPQIESSRVHIVLPQKTLFIEDERKPQVSVILTLAKGQKLDPRNVQAMVNLLLMAIEGLDKGHIAITDSAGRVLFSPVDESSMLGMSTTQLEHKEQMQRIYERRIEELLYPKVGASRIVARVNADLDFSQKTIQREIYDPEKSVIVSEIRSEETQNGRADLSANTVDPNFRGDGAGTSASTQQGSRESRTTNYALDKETQNIVSQVGDIARLTISVIVDGTYAKDEEGNWVFTPRSPEEIESIKQLVANAVGFSDARGDSIVVNCTPFGEPETEFGQNLTSLVVDYTLRLGKPLLNALLAFLFLLLIVRPVVLAVIKPKVEGEMIEGLEGLPVGEERLALMEADDNSTDALMTSLKQIEDVKLGIMQLSEQNMDQAITILRSWLKDAERSKIAA